MDSNYIVHGHREHPKGVAVPQIVFVGKRQPAQIVKGTHIINLYPNLIESLLVKGNSVVHSGNRFLQSSQLNSL